MSEDYDYAIHKDVKFGSLTLIDVNEISTGVTDDWFNQTLCQVNDCVVRIGVFEEGEFHWHQHEKEDEFFFVVSGRLIIELEDRTVELGQNQGFTIPIGVKHKPRAPERTIVLMVEGAGVEPTGDN